MGYEKNRNLVHRLAKEYIGLFKRNFDAITNYCGWIAPKNFGQVIGFGKGMAFLLTPLFI